MPVVVAQDVQFHTRDVAPNPVSANVGTVGCKRHGLEQGRLAALGFALLGSCGVVVNLLDLDFSRLLGAYVGIFAIVSVAMRPVLREAASRVEDLRMPPSNRLDPLHGNRSGQGSIRVNDQWRLCFRFEDGDAFDVEIVDHHRGNGIMTKKTLVTIHPGELLAETLGELGRWPSCSAGPSTSLRCAG